MAYQNHRDLRVWQMAIELATNIYKITEKFPKNEIYGLGSQIQRAAVSISANIAEGNGRDSDPEMVRFLNYSLGSACEVDSHIEIACNLNYCTKEEKDYIQAFITTELKSLYSFKRKVEQRIEADKIKSKNNNNGQGQKE